MSAARRPVVARPPPWRRRQGVTLLLVLTLLVLLLTIVFAFFYETTVEVAIAENMAYDFETTIAAKGGVNYALARLRAKDLAEKKKSWDSLLQPWAQEFSPPGLEGMTLTIRLVDEERKINLHFLLDQYRKAGPRTADYARYQVVAGALVRLIEAVRDENPALAVSDLPADELPARDLVEELERWINEKPVDESYELQEELSFDETVPEEATRIKKESPFPIITLQELRFVGFSERLINGDDQGEFVGAERAAAELPTATTEGEVPDYSGQWVGRGLRDFVTAYSTRRINVNTVDPLTLAALLFAAAQTAAEIAQQPAPELDFNAIYAEARAFVDLRTNGSAREEERDPAVYPNAGEPGWDATTLDTGVVNGVTVTGAANNGVNDYWEQVKAEEAADPEQDTDTRNSFKTVADAATKMAADPEKFPTILPYYNYLRGRGVLDVRSRYFLVHVTATKQVRLERPGEDAESRAAAGYRKTIDAWFERDAQRNFRLIVQNIE